MKDKAISNILNKKYKERLVIAHAVIAGKKHKFGLVLCVDRLPNCVRH